MKLIPNAVSRFGGRTALRLSAASPTLLVVTGVVGFGVTAVMAAKAARAADPVLEDHAKQRFQIAELELSEQDERSEIVALHKNTILSLGKVYGPTIIVGTVSAASILYGHRLLRGRHVATMLAYSGLQEQFLAYRGRVAKTLGDKVENEIFNGAHHEYVEDADHKGEYRLAPVYADDTQASYLTPWFDERNDNCRFDPVGNYLFLKGAQSHANNLLEIRGHVFLNEVLKAIGMPEVPEGQVAGWLRDGGGDNYVDFGFMTGTDPHTQAFRDGAVRDVKLNFNIDGNIFQMMMDRKHKQLN